PTRYSLSILKSLISSCLQGDICCEYMPASSSLLFISRPGFFSQPFLSRYFWRLASEDQSSPFCLLIKELSLQQEKRYLITMKKCLMFISLFLRPQRLSRTRFLLFWQFLKEPVPQAIFSTHCFLLICKKNGLC